MITGLKMWSLECTQAGFPLSIRKEIQGLFKDFSRIIYWISRIQTEMSFNTNYHIIPFPGMQLWDCSKLKEAADENSKLV